MGIKQVVKAEKDRGRAIMKAAVKAGIPHIGMTFFEHGRPVAEFEKVCASLRGEPGTFGHLAGVGPDRTADDINASLFTGPGHAASVAASILAAGNKAGYGSRA